MRTNVTSIESLVKDTVSSSWRVSIVSPSSDNIIVTTIGEGGRTQVGPRLGEVLSSMEKEIKAYPFRKAWSDLALSDSNNFTVKMLGEEVVYIEVSVQTYKQLRKPVNKSTVSSQPKVMSRTPYGEESEVTLATSELTSGETDASSGPASVDYLVVVKTSGVIDYTDADTFTVKIEKSSKHIKSVDKDNAFDEGKEIKVRLAGLNAPEVPKKNEAAHKGAISRNTEYAQKFNITPEKALEIGTEASEYAKNILSKSGLIVIDIDADENGVPKLDAHNRYIGVVYKTSLTNPDDAFTNDTNYGVHLNKTLLSTYSKIVTGAPLAVPYFFFITSSEEHTRFDVNSWLYELGIYNTPSDIKIGEVLEDAIIGGDDPDAPPLDYDPITIEYKESASNALDFFEAFDDRLDELYPHGQDERDHHVRIGDVKLVIPPLAIQVNRTSSLEKVKTLRSRSSIITKVGSSATTISMQLYFHSLDSINGYEWDNGQGLTYHMDGLRPLLAQFKKAPFLPIDNNYINKTLGIYSVALVNLSVATVPGFPHSITATLTLAKFDHEAYMPQLPYLGSAINYPMLRWYYQETMKQSLDADGNPNPYRSYLAPIEGELTNDFSFLIANEAELMERNNAIVTLRQKDEPLIYREKLKNKETEIGKLISDGLKAEAILNQHSIYTSLKNAGLIPKPYDDKGTIWVSDQLWYEWPANQQAQESFLRIYGSKHTTRDTAPDNYGAFFHPYEGYWFVEKRPALYKESYYNLGYEHQDNERAGYASISLDSDSNFEIFPENYHPAGPIPGTVGGTNDPAKNKDGSKRLYIPMTEENLARLKRVVNKAKEAENTALEYVNEYNKLKSIVEQAESHLELTPIISTPSGDQVGLDSGSTEMIVTSINVMYENSFAPIQLQQNDTPTLQYLGSQDPYIQVSIEGTEATVSAIQLMLSEADRYSREYRVGITSGFIGIENQLTNLFGVRTVMVETVNITTVPGFPGRFQIQMTLCGFDKTQKRMEELEGISPIYGDTDKADRRVSKDPWKADNAIIEMKMAKLEAYPDLELPTYDELNNMLPKMGAGITVYENRSGSKFVDPDFYVATKWTMREEIRNKRLQPQRVNLTDKTGIRLHTDSLSSDYLMGEEDMMAIINEADEKTPRITPSSSWDADTTTATGRQAHIGAGPLLGLESMVSQEIDSMGADDPEGLKEWLKNKQNVLTKPTLNEWIEWNGGSANPVAIQAYHAWLNNPHPKEDQIYKKIYEIVDKFWTNQFAVYNDSNVDLNKKAWKKVTYEATADDLWRAHYNHNAKTKPDKFVSDDKVEYGNLSEKDYKATDNKITRERIANIAKAMVHYLSKWQQYSTSKQPFYDSLSTGVGLGKIPLTYHARNIKMAKRLAWDWKYNLEYTITYLYDKYLDALVQTDPKYWARPWDYMVRAYEQGTLNTYNGEKDDTLETPFYMSVMGIYSRYYGNRELIYGTPTTAMNIEIFRLKNGLSQDELLIAIGNKQALIDELIKHGYGKGGKNKTAAQEATVRAELDKMSDEQVREIYEEEMKGLEQDLSQAGTEADLQEGQVDMWSEVLFDKEEKAETFKETANYDNFEEFRKTTKGVNILINTDDPTRTFQDMFHDAVEYDQKGRMLRAFPTFSMFIIDEGKWMTNYKLWDNLYGFNAIQSIDVHKSRKIAADTCVIRMTNIYSNLTSKALDTSYGNWNYSFWDNLVFGNPSEELIESRKELLNSMMLKTGARIHLRMGYGASVRDLPVVFNGTITEMGVEDVVELIAQGDGIELTNVISGDPGDENKNFFRVNEPRDTICELLTSKGNWFKDAINYTSGGEFFKENPLGIQHFGTPGRTPEANAFMNWFNDDYGEAAQNIYASNGAASYSQWSMPNGESHGWSWSDTPFWDWLQPGDEPNIIVPFYNNTTWDIAQTMTYCNLDYIAAVHPFEMRSTLFYGKPYWRLAYRYDSTYEFLPDRKEWKRKVNYEHRKPYMQFHLLDGLMDIVSNRIKASEDGTFTNVIANYDGQQSDIAYADWDIRYDKQRTTVVDAKIVARMPGLDFFTSKAQANYFAASSVKDFMKDMYKGQLVVIGDPTLKPHDMCYMGDRISQMEGNFMVKSVVHSFSHETGFISTIEPDAVVVNDDLSLLSQSTWFRSFGIGITAAVLGRHLIAQGIRKFVGTGIGAKALELGKAGSWKAAESSIKKMVEWLPEDDPDVKEFKKAVNRYFEMDRLMGDTDTHTPTGAQEAYEKEKEKRYKNLVEKHEKVKAKVAEWEAQGLFETKDGVKIKGLSSKRNTKRLVSITGYITKALKDTKNAKTAFTTVKVVGAIAFATTPVGWIASAVGTVMAETILEKYRRKKAMMQCVVIAPMKYQGRDFTAGINGHAGSVVGDNPGRMDNFLEGLGFEEKDEDEGLTEFFTWVASVFNWVADADRDWSITEEELMSGQKQDE